mmetsp:Transcript_21374/g.32776  ORF Transcript_21374/g.32776 Transcript_21374/m.32776 type:complete len:319 (+) Transcript_21374:151-1107(+)
MSAQNTVAAQPAPISKWILSAQALVNSPSRQDGMSLEEEREQLRKATGQIYRAGQESKIPKESIVTAMIFLIRFYGLQSFRKYNRFIIAQACLFLAAKVEETPTKLYKVITACHSVRNAGQAGERIDINSEEYTKEKNAVLEAERIILYTINYELDSTPINPTLIFKNILSKLIETRIIDENNKSFMNNGVNIMWASLRTNLPLQFEPKKIASACAFLTTIYSKLMPKDKTKLNIFFKIIDTSERTLKAISQQVAEIYLDNEAADDFIVELATAGWIPQAMAERRIKNTRLDSSIVPPLKKIRSSPSITPTHFPSDAA